MTNLKNIIKEAIIEQLQKNDLIVNHKEISNLHPDAKKKFDQLYKMHKSSINKGKTGIHATLSKDGQDMDIHVHTMYSGNDRSKSNGTATTVASEKHKSPSFSLVHHKSLKFNPSASWNGGHYIPNKINETLEEEKYNPLKPITRSLSFNDFEGHKGAEDYEAVKKIKWPYGVEVKFDDKNKEVTFKTAKMKTVAELLDKTVDFDSISAGEALDLPAELMGAYLAPKGKARFKGKF